MENFSADTNSQIETVQTFFKFIGDCDEAASLLLGRNVFNLKGEKKLVNSWHPKELKIAVLSESFVITRYLKNEFIENFSKIHPPISLESIIPFIEKKQKEKEQELIREEKNYKRKDINRKKSKEI